MPAEAPATYDARAVYGVKVVSPLTWLDYFVGPELATAAPRVERRPSRTSIIRRRGFGGRIVCR